MDTTVSIIIATASRLVPLKETLISLCSVRIPDELIVELILIENGSRSGIEDYLCELPPHSFTIRYMFEPAPGKSRSLNIAIRKAMGDILVFTDDDVRFPREWLVEMCMPLARGEGEVVVGGCRLAPHLLRDWLKPYHRSFLASTEYLSESEPSEFAGVNAACLRKVFEKVPQFDRELGAAGPPKGEDALFARQLKQAGYRFISKTHIWVEHHPLKTRLMYKSWITAAVSAGRSRAYILHHWDHAEIPFAHAQLYYLRAKLSLRMLLTGTRIAEAEGIGAWELSYRQDITKIDTFIKIRNRPRNYSLRGLRYRETETQAVTV
jgi:glucosyl-dolichyl phosphate glucuronosyltransferase